MYKNREQLLEVLMKSLPYTNQIGDIDLSNEDSIYFSWRSNRFKIDTYGSCDVHEGGCLIGNDISILLRELMKKVLTTMEIESQRKSIQTP